MVQIYGILYNGTGQVRIMGLTRRAPRLLIYSRRAGQ